jgi:hypothetical protein
MEPVPSCSQEDGMSDIPQGPGWWQAADQKWYPPELHPGYQAQQSAAPQSSFEPPPGPGVNDSLEAKTFIRSLYDFSFSSFITLRVIRVLYILITILYTLFAFIFLVVALVAAVADHRVIELVVAIIVVPIAYFIYLTVARISMEILMVLFNIGKDVRSIRERGDTRLGRGPAGGAPGVY